MSTGNRQGEPDKGSIRIDAEQLHHISGVTIAHYDRLAKSYWDGTRDHDVSQNYAALLDAIEGDPPYSILDLGCGPGRDLRYFRSLGHEAVGLDGSKEFVAMARSYSGCEVLHQDFLAMALPEKSLRRRVCKCGAIPRAEPRVTEGIARTLQNLEAQRGPVLLKPERKQRGRL